MKLKSTEPIKELGKFFIYIDSDKLGYPDMIMISGDYYDAHYDGNELLLGIETELGLRGTYYAQPDYETSGSNIITIDPIQAVNLNLTKEDIVEIYVYERQLCVEIELRPRSNIDIEFLEEEIRNMRVISVGHTINLEHDNLFVYVDVMSVGNGLSWGSLSNEMDEEIPLYILPALETK